MGSDYSLCFFLATKILGISPSDKELVYIRPYTLEIVDKINKREYLYKPTADLNQAFEVLGSKAFRFVIENASINNKGFHWELREYPDGTFEIRLPYLYGVYISSDKNLPLAICKAIVGICDNTNILDALKIFHTGDNNG
jgi:hypothetical protein